MTEAHLLWDGDFRKFVEFVLCSKVCDNSKILIRTAKKVQKFCPIFVIVGIDNVPYFCYSYVQPNLVGIF